MATYLHETGTVYVTLAAAQTFARAAGLQMEEARRRLTELLLDARRMGETDSGAEQWRVRSRTTGLDIGAHVAREGRLAVIVHVQVREVPERGPRT